MNKTIENARNVALDILRPRPAELERGLELHKQSLVIDAYGFCPRAAIDGEILKQKCDEGADSLELQLVLEGMQTRFVTNESQRRELCQAWDASGVTCIFQNAGEEGQTVKTLLSRLALYTYLTDMIPETISKAVLPDDVVRAKEANRRCLYFTSNGVPLGEQWNSVEQELVYIEMFFQLGIRMMHLTYNRRNMLGNGCTESSDAGLSDFGRAAVAEMNRVGVIVDAAHSGWQTSMEAAKYSSVPVVVSHACSAELNAHPRGKSDEVIRAISDNGGYVGVCCIPAFLGRTGDINAFLDHIDYIAKKFGPDHVAIGSDVSYVLQDAPGESSELPPRQSRPRWNDFWQDDDPLFDPKWNKPHQFQSLAWTNWPLFTVGLIQRGYTDDDIQKILGGNVLRVARAVMDSRCIS